MNSRNVKDSKVALIVSTKAGLGTFESGATLRLKTITEICKQAGYSVYTTGSTFKLLRTFRQYDLIVFTSFSVAWKRVFVKRVSESIIWYDFVDSIKLTGQMQKKLNFPLKNKASNLRAKAIVPLLPQPNLVTYISERDAIADKGIAPWIDQVHILPNLVKPYIPKENMPERFIFLGSMKYPPNRFGLISLLKEIESMSKYEILPLIHVIGDNEIELVSEYPKVNWHGYSDYFPSARDIHIAPIFYGAGIKNKVAIPLMSGMRVISTEEGASGLKKSDNLLIAKSSREFVKFMYSLIEKDYNENKQDHEIFIRNETEIVLKLIRNELNTQTPRNENI